ncbi:hypothetical protein LQ948_00955 [Jiella sp. MQZ9-1]|uniref:Uncharacterized protein n=1 Tax=Jiella flava TaxID=2816857 RepID=A0A939JSI6_9HYPH|nr:hypothetical protein [Jiella flava]MBO0661130.1 hypothetical protein [Jiella flava]MCD2469776.1 hypothetical protein [Jiella flava]
MSPTLPAIFALTGAGVSTKSGVETVRDKGWISSTAQRADPPTPEDNGL